MRPVRLAVIALAAATLAACSNGITSPTGVSPTNGPSLGKSTCRTGYLLSSGRCSSGVTIEAAPDTSAQITTSDDGCRTGYLLASGRCGR
jgi:hypothetical protein